MSKFQQLAATGNAPLVDLLTYDPKNPPSPGYKLQPVIYNNEKYFVMLLWKCNNADHSNCRLGFDCSSHFKTRVEWLTVLQARVRKYVSDRRPFAAVYILKIGQFANIDDPDIIFSDEVQFPFVRTKDPDFAHPYVYFYNKYVLKAKK